MSTYTIRKKIVANVVAGRNREEAHGVRWLLRNIDNSRGAHWINSVGRRRQWHRIRRLMWTTVFPLSIRTIHARV